MTDTESRPDKIDKFYSYFWRVSEVYFAVFGIGIHIAFVVAGLAWIVNMVLRGSN